MGKDLQGKELGNGLSQRKNGTYCARFEDRFGKRISIYGKSLPALKRRMKEAMRRDWSSSAGGAVASDYTFDTWFEEWMKVYKKFYRPTSRRMVTSTYFNLISPHLGHCKLSEVTVRDIQHLINHLNAKGYAKETQLHAYSAINDMLDKAMADGLAIKNPAKAVRVHSEKNTEKTKALTRQEQALFFSCAKGTFYEELFVVAVTTGLRPGELTALCVEDVDLKKRTIRVNKTLTYIKDEETGKFHFSFGAPKTEKGNRMVVFGEKCEQALRKQLAKRAKIVELNEFDSLPGFERLLFLNRVSHPISSATFCRESLRISQQSDNHSGCGSLPYFHPHCFRHTYATRCFEAGVDPKIVQEQMGHTSFQMTMDLYTHLQEEKKREDMTKHMSRIEEFL